MTQPYPAATIVTACFQIGPKAHSSDKYDAWSQKHVCIDLFFESGFLIPQSII
jgi:hypothetical protein